jgi:hypothetical protein
MAASEGINYEAVLADLEARRAQLDAAIAAIKAITGLGPVSSAGVTSTAQTGNTNIAHDTFFGLSIPEATKTLLGIMKRRLSTPDVIKYLTQGGMPEPAYNTTYAVLRRRQNQIGDIININGEWSLKEWAPGYKPPKGKKGKNGDSPDTATTEAAGTDEVGEEEAPGQEQPEGGPEEV